MRSSEPYQTGRAPLPRTGLRQAGIQARSVSGSVDVLVMRQQLDHERQEVACDLPVAPTRILHGVDEADGAVFGSYVIVTASIAGYGQPPQFRPAGKQIPPPYHVNVGCVGPLPENAASFVLPGRRTARL